MGRNRGYGIFGLILALIVILAILVVVTGENKKNPDNNSQMNYDDTYESIVGEKPTE